jgi:Kdo2-lipid IVA lauroyltransferase/acyltransferase
MRWMLDALTRLPLPVLYRIGRGVRFVAFHIVRWRRAIALDNIVSAFPGRSRAEHAAILRASYDNLADVLAETVWAYGADAAELRARVTIEGGELITDRIARGESPLLLTAHFCNWEWLLLAAGAHLRVPIDAVYKPPRQRVFDEFLRDGRARFGGTPVPYKGFVMELMRRRGAARCYAMVADQTPIAQDDKYWTTFMGRDTAFYTGADTIARTARTPVLFVAMQRCTRGHYHVRVMPVASPPYVGDAGHAIVEKFVRLLEAEIRKSPADWLWIHRKWKYAKPLYA